MQSSNAYLQIETEWLSGEYHGQEWPPSPARLFQALVAAWMTGSNRLELGDTAEQALLWLEKQPPPLIVTPPEQIPLSYRIPVPNNDLDKPARAWAKGASDEVSKYRTLKEIPTRGFTCSLGRVRYVWSLASAPDAAILANLTAIVHCLHTFGWGRDMAFADLQLTPEPTLASGELWHIVSRGGVRLPVPTEGFLADLKRCHAHFLRRSSPSGFNSDSRPREYVLERYARAGVEQRPLACFHLRMIDNSSGVPQKITNAFTYPSDRAQDVAAWLRHAALEALKEDERPEWGPYVSGHAEDPNARLSFVPLPSVGHAHTDANIRRVLLAEPLGAPGDVSFWLQQALAGAILTDEHLSPRAWLDPTPDSDPVLRLYSAESSTWKTVTPVILHGYDSLRGSISLNKTKKLLLDAFDKAGYDRNSIIDFYVQQAPLVPNAPAARRAWRASHLRRWPSYHVWVRFDRRVKGPLIAGIGRHYGFGLFIPAK